MDIGGGKVYSGGDKWDVVVGMNGGGLKREYKFCKGEGVIMMEWD